MPASAIEPTELISVDDTIDGIAREALAEAKRIEEAERFRKSPGPLIAPDPCPKPYTKDPTA